MARKRARPRRPAPPKAAAPKSPPLAPSQRAAFVAVFVVLVLGIIGVLEVALRAWGFGAGTLLYVRPRYASDLYVEDMPYYNRYFDKSLWVKSGKLQLNRSLFDRRKQPGTLRGFVLGESAAQGFPYASNHAFSGMIEAALRASGRYAKVEILNVADSAISSYAIRDIAGRLGAYEPDLLVIYAGNNEYYGTISESTGGDHSSRNLYLRLKDFALFDAAAQAWNGDLTGTPAPSGQSLMETRFAQKRYPPDVTTDTRVASNFVRNLDAIVSRYAPSIPVILVEPVANLVDMPPFAGVNDEALGGMITRYAQAVRAGDVARAREIHDGERRQAGADENACVRYLDGLYARLRDPRTGDDRDFVAARDLDAIPFRPRTTALHALRDYARTRATSLPRLHFVPLGDRLQAQLGPTALGRDLFLDHVHFNQKGHRLVAQAVVSELGDVLALSADQKAAAAGVLADDASASAAVHCPPYYRVYPSLTLDTVFEAPPFSTMLVPFEPDHEEAERALHDMGYELTLAIADKNRRAALDTILEYYKAHGAMGAVVDYLLAERFAFPGSYKAYLDLARFAASFPERHDFTARHYRMAWLLSDKDPTLEQEAAAYGTAPGAGEAGDENRDHPLP